MVEELNKVTTLEGISGKKYTFSLWSFEIFDDVKSTFTGGGLYLFTRRHSVGGQYMHDYIYLGETEDYYVRFNGHHKEQSIMGYQANCIGFYPMPNVSQSARKEVEADLLGRYNFPCNEANN